MQKPPKTIYVTFQKEGIHAYPEAGTDPSLQDVSFLASPHRHIFHFKVWLEVKHDNRDVEFIQFKRALETAASLQGEQLNNKSCEMLADDVAEFVRSNYPARWVAVDVAEDGENGAYCEYPRQETISCDANELQRCWGHGDFLDTSTQGPVQSLDPTKGPLPPRLNTAFDGYDGSAAPGEYPDSFPEYAPAPPATRVVSDEVAAENNRIYSSYPPGNSEEKMNVYWSEMGVPWEETEDYAHQARSQLSTKQYLEIMIKVHQRHLNQAKQLLEIEEREISKWEVATKQTSEAKPVTDKSVEEFFGASLLSNDNFP